MSDWIRLNRKILDWEWYKDPNTKSLFLHLLIKANWKEGRFMGKPIKRGQLVTGRKALATETGIKETTIERHLKRLIESGEIEQQTNNKNRVITICNYDRYQTQNNASEQQTDNKRTTNGQQTDTIEEGKKERRKENYIVFDEFYKHFPKKKGKAAAEKAWSKLKVEGDLFKTILSSLEKQKQSGDWKKDNGQFIPYPATWLNGKRWEDETETVVERDTW